MMRASPRNPRSSRYASFQRGKASVAKRGESGSGSSSMTLLRAVSSLWGCGRFHSSVAGGSGSAVIGRACTIERAPVAERPFDIHRLAVELLDLHAQPRQLGGLREAPARPAAAGRRARALRGCLPASRTVITSLSAISCDSIARVCLSTMNVSGVTCPPTIASPSPQAALIITLSRAPVRGLAVKRMPATSAGTSCCTTTASATSSGADALTRAVAEGAGRPQRRPAPLHGLQHLLAAADVEDTCPAGPRTTSRADPPPWPTSARRRADRPDPARHTTGGSSRRCRRGSCPASMSAWICAETRVERSGVVGLRFPGGGEDRLGELVLAHEAAIGGGGDVEAGRHGQARRRQPRQRRTLAAHLFERGVRAVQLENQRITRVIHESLVVARQIVKMENFGYAAAPR